MMYIDKEHVYLVYLVYLVPVARFAWANPTNGFVGDKV